MEDLLASDLISDSLKATLGGLVIGLAFGAFAQASRFCLRSATIEFWSRRRSDRLGASVTIWLFVFGAALLATQALFANGSLEQTAVRQLSSPGTMSGAIIGGLLFGIGMILARGCASRLLVLSATGNVRALLTGMVVTVVAQASLSGLLSPLRTSLSSIWVVAPDIRNMMLHVPDGTGIAAGAACVALASALAMRNRIGWSRPAFAAGLGITVAAGWAFTAALARVSFEPVNVGSVTFTGPSADTLMALIAMPSVTLDFSIGLVPGVFIGSFVSALARREFKIQVFTVETGTVRYVIGGILLGFGGMLAGGCAVGAGITGGAVLSSTAWVALFCMWIGAAVAQRWLETPVATVEPAAAGP